jgi:anti-anti-sigma factor
VLTRRWVVDRAASGPRFRDGIRGSQPATLAPPVATPLADESGHATIVLRGELEVASAEFARLVVDQALTLGPNQLVFDMGELGFMDSSGIAVLVHAANQVGRMVLAKPNDMVRPIIEITPLSSVFGIES